MRRALTMLILVFCPVHIAEAGELFDEETLAFAERVDAKILSTLAVQYGGRVAILDTLARQQLRQIWGAERVDGTSPSFAYLELYFNSGRYLDRPVLYVQEPRMRRALLAGMDAGLAEQFRRSHRLPPMAVMDDEMFSLLVRTGRTNVRDTAKLREVPSMESLFAALGDYPWFRVPLDRLSLRISSFLAVGVFRPVPVADGRWLTAEDVLTRSGVSASSDRPAGAGETFVALRDAWRSRRAWRVNELATLLSEQARSRAVEYPSRAIRNLELLYNRAYKGSVTCAGFALATLVLIAAAGSERRMVYRLGMAVLIVSTFLLLAGFGVRWILSGRPWYLPPIMNQFEAVTGSALLGAILAIVLEMVRRRIYLALAASLYATIALLAGLLFPHRMGAEITAAHGILNSPIMAAHVAFIIVGHAMAGMTLLLSVAYLLAWAWRVDPVVSTAADSSGPVGQSPSAVIDRCNLIVAQIACWALTIGTILGAYWADFAWGRPWGWDRKETWALITAVIYVVTIHVRFLVGQRRRGLVTAGLCMLGGAAMLFNWIGVNYFFVGIHSYA